MNIKQKSRITAKKLSVDTLITMLTQAGLKVDVKVSRPAA